MSDTSTIGQGAPELDDLRAACAGPVHLPGDAGYDTARLAWNVAVEQRPAAVVRPRTADEVVAVVRAAARAGLRVAPQATGHNAGPLEDLRDVVLLRTAGLTGITVDADRRTARVGSGVAWEDVVAAVAPHGLVALHGSSPDVAVGGYSLGGGVGWFGRRFGLQCNSVVALEVVLPHGELVRVDAGSDPELFWALRGGGGNFGVVTALEFALYPVTSVYGGALVWDWREAGRVLTRWSQWATGAPDEVTTSFRILQLPPIEAVPLPLRGRQVVMIDGAVLAEDGVAVDILAPLRELGPEIDTFARMPAPELVRLHGDPEEPMPVASSAALLGSMPAEAVDAFVRAAGAESGSILAVAELRQFGGALGRPDPRAGVLPMLDGQFALYCCALAAGPEAVVGSRHAERLAEAMAPWTAGHYLNFAETALDTELAYGAEAYKRLQAVRRRVDPHGLMVANHPVPADA
ncbi:FAD-binding oxidoreductase [Pseudonocardia xinjiangensis]|uniref:FAD-binding oxidoreductase n=1 Tax=Pseudonocardia xinjiangensis TaxID=75289 RepID=UPI001B7D0B65|nr:FAD-binding oxidoreductase [Pseudonocardia xinjiangensis]